ncbi:MAG: hypothetical protein A2289_11400 [Deltaproteobacteria bacterium RIFOXYA12_FULL_58_15]|nr:MAG: hypothetical protein A2289_11400 [Deltaproteobacteria bacterium RIFOXYA12_FULL_58_15]OGR09696.1 MAG: hypothetical protein A2341_14890 [Deltaproteobacteria bacterium RIFOXYB12_FULL_58_9]
MDKTTLLTLVGFLAAGCVEPASIVIEPLRVINWSPASNTICVTTETNISATFSDDLVADSINSDTFVIRDADGVVEAAVTYDKTSFTARLQPQQSLAFDRSYTIIAKESIRGLAKGQLAVDLEASFTTVPRYGCTPGVECEYHSDCPGNQICARTGVCIDECVTSKDCYRGTCASGICIPDSGSDGGPVDDGVGDGVNPGDDVSPGDGD